MGKLRLSAVCLVMRSEDADIGCHVLIPGIVPGGGFGKIGKLQQQFIYQKILAFSLALLPSVALMSLILHLLLHCQLQRHISQIQITTYCDTKG